MPARFSPPPRVTHVVLIDGLPVDSWVVTGADAGLYADRDRWDDPDDSRPWSGENEAWSPDDDLGWDPVTGEMRRTHPWPVGPPEPPRPSQEELRLLDLEELVGGPDALTALDALPLSTERVDPQSVPPELREVVDEVLGRCDDVVDRWFDEETRTVLHRLVGVIVADRPTLLADPDIARSAASLCWMVGRGNGFVGPVFGTHTVTNKALLEHFHQPSNIVEAFAARLLPKAAAVRGVGDGWSAGGQGWRRNRTRPQSSYLLGRPEWLVARRRLSITRERDELHQTLADRAAAMAATTAATLITAATGDPPPLETASDPDQGAPEWERSLRLLSGP